MLEEFPTSGLYEMYGEHIRLCIMDYVVGFRLFHNKSKRYVRRMIESNDIKKHAFNNYITAKAYLFEGLLEESVEKFGLPLETDFVKKYAINVAKGDYKFTNRKTIKIGRLYAGMCSVWGDNNSEE